MMAQRKLNVRAAATAAAVLAVLGLGLSSPADAQPVASGTMPAAVTAAHAQTLAAIGFGIDVGFGRSYVGYRSGRYYGHRAYRHYYPYRYRSPYRYYYPRFYSTFGYGPWYYGGVYAYDRYAYAPDAGALDLNIKPKKAQVWLDGEYVGRVDAYDGFPRYLWMRAGTHHLVVYQEGYQSLAREVRVRRGEILALRTRLAPGESKTPEELFAQLKPREEQRAEPRRPVRPRADVRPDDRYERDRERADREARDRDLRDRDRRDRARESEQWRDSDSIPRDQRSEPARLRVRVAPDDAVVYLDGRLLGSGRELQRLHSDLLVDPGEHRIEVTRPGYEPWVRDLDVPAGETVDLEAELEPEQ